MSAVTTHRPSAPNGRHVLTTWWSGLLAVLLVCYGSPAEPANPANPSLQDRAKPAAILKQSRVQIRSRNLVRRQPNFILESEYPELACDNPATVRDTNKCIRNWTLQQMEELAKIIPDGPPAPGFGFYRVEGHYEVFFQNDELLSVSYIFTVDCGYLHPYHFYRGVTLQMHPARVITLADIFGGTPDYDLLSDLCKEQVSGDRDLDEIWIDRGLAPQAENFSHFLVDATGVTIRLQEYQIGCYTCSRPDVTLDYALLKPVMSTTCSVFNLAKDVRQIEDFDVTSAAGRSAHLHQSRIEAVQVQLENLIDSKEPDCLPVKARLYESLGDLHIEDGECEEAIEAYSLGLRADASAASLRSRRGTVYMRLSRFETALADFEVAVQAYERAVSHRQNYQQSSPSGQTESAYQHMEKTTTSLEQQLTASDAHSPGPVWKQVAGQKPEAFFQWAASIKDVLPDSDAIGSSCYFDRGLALKELCHYDRALADFTRAIQLAPDFADAYRERAGVYLQLGQHDLASHDYNHLEKLNRH